MDKIKNFKEFYESKFGKYPGRDAEFFSDMFLRLANCFAEYTEHVSQKKDIDCNTCVNKAKYENRAFPDLAMKCMVCKYGEWAQDFYEEKEQQSVPTTVDELWDSLTTQEAYRFNSVKDAIEFGWNACKKAFEQENK